MITAFFTGILQRSELGRSIPCPERRAGAPKRREINDLITILVLDSKELFGYIWV